jgi:hypothetical protein
MIWLWFAIAMLWSFHAWSAQVNYEEALMQGGIPPFNGFSMLATTGCEDTGANGSCDGNSAGATNSIVGNWTKPYNCRGKAHVSAYLGQEASVTGNTTAAVYNCHEGYNTSAAPSTQPRYCQNVSDRFNAGDLTDAAPDFSPQAWGGGDLIVGQFSCTTNCERSRFTVTCF